MPSNFFGVSTLRGALDHLHAKGFVHRDIKPDNFVWVENSNTEVMMIDLGIAKRTTEDVSGRPLDIFTRTLEFVGPAFFSSPELIAYARDKTVTVDQRSDIFQLGKTIWFLATGQVSAGVPARRRCPVSGRLHSLVTRMVDDDPAGRPESAAALASEIEAL